MLVGRDDVRQPLVLDHHFLPFTSRLLAKKIERDIDTFRALRSRRRHMMAWEDVRHDRCMSGPTRDLRRLALQREMQ